MRHGHSHPLVAALDMGSHYLGFLVRPWAALVARVERRLDEAGEAGERAIKDATWRPDPREEYCEDRSLEDY